MTKFTHPEDANKFPALYRKLSPHNQTLFLDLDDTLVFTSLYKLNGDKGSELIIEEKDGSRIKVSPFTLPRKQIAAEKGKTFNQRSFL